MIDEAFAAELTRVLGPDGVQLQPEQRSRYDHDIFEQGAQVPDAVLAPTSVEQLAQAVRLATAAGLAVVPRGGGMSYTGGYLSARPGFVTIDLRRMNRVRAINLEDMYITVEAGCTWNDVYRALEGSGCRTPYWGPLSGLLATVGGALSQNSIFFGAGQHGSAAESVLGMEVVLASGEVLATGAGNRVGGTPFSRWGGPDLTGLFVGDCGALGVKAVATLRLVPCARELAHASFGFETIEHMTRAQVELTRRGLPSECFGVDDYKIRNSSQMGNKLISGAKTLIDVAAAGKSLLSGVRSAAKVALSARSLADYPYSIHLTAEGASQAEVEARMAEIEKVAAECGGSVTEGAIPKVLRARPFVPLRSVLGFDGQRWVPVHAVLPLSRAVEAVEATERFFAERRALMEEHGIVYSPLTSNFYNSFLLEPCFYWYDEILPLHVEVLGEELTRPWRTRAANPAARAAVLQMRAELAAIYDRMGGIHFQIGRAYAYLDTLQPQAGAAVRQLKAVFDPRGLMNPGSLGL
ncbi:FAD-binding oxidoreductase [Massilia oculi]|uniref:D-lactate dehydrogenase (cytochrome) n=1 Tax=Massilia hydrophila TaxID=3044279 RepID=A0ABS7YGH5_9BURK|nr:FAD-binding oxidoreductase [Massilia oculi]MCA1857349.1 FAD-binding oxidoreductase [Massilia oculi]